MREYICQYYYMLTLKNISVNIIIFLTLKKYRCKYYYTLISKNTYVSILCINIGMYMLILTADGRLRAHR